MVVQQSFQRYEEKYLLTGEQYGQLMGILTERMEPDVYGAYSICNIYYDTPDYELIRNSIEKPVYKEKFRLRSYGVPDEDGIIFAEIKKKYSGIVSKRRVADHPDVIMDFLERGRPLGEGSRQIQSEIQWFMHMYRPMPKVFIAYERSALVDSSKEELRITFDRNLRWRCDELDLQAGDQGECLLPDDMIVMEVKTSGSVPLWLADALSGIGIFPTSFSKYGLCYQMYIAPKYFQKERVS